MHKPRPYPHIHVHVYVYVRTRGSKASIHDTHTGFTQGAQGVLSPPLGIDLLSLGIGFPPL